MKLERYQKLEEIMNTGMYYIDTEQGGLWSNKRKGQWLKPNINYNGYPYFMFCYAGKPFKYYLHELVAYQVFGKELIGLTVNHIDGNKKNNGRENLELATMSEQCIHAFGIGLRQTKVTVPIAQEIINLYDTGDYTQIDIAKMFKIGRSTVQHIINGDTWKHIPRTTAV